MFCYPIPTTAQIEGGPGANGDNHVLYLDTTGAPNNCTLYRNVRHATLHEPTVGCGQWRDLSPGVQHAASRSMDEAPMRLGCRSFRVW